MQRIVEPRARGESGQFGERRGARAGVINVGHCLEPNGTSGGRNGVIPRLPALGDDGVAGIAAHQLVVHQVVVAEEQLRRPSDRR